MTSGAVAERTLLPAPVGHAESTDVVALAAARVAGSRVAFGYQPREERLDPSFMMLVDPEGIHLPLSLQKAGEPPHEPVRLHLDL